VKLWNLLEDKKKFALVVSLPANREELAAAAIEGGADAIKVHLNVEHRASKTKFGSFKDERKRIEAIVKLAGRKVAVGVMPGAARIASVTELDELSGMGLEFVDCYVHDYPASHLGHHGKLRTMLALGHEYRFEEVRGMGALGVEAVEASIVDPKGYGQPLMTADLMAYRAIAAATKLPVVVPTQRAIRPDEVPLLAWAGAHGVIIGAIVTGKKADGVRAATRAFRESIASSL
jgi:hypothetical protein